MILTFSLLEETPAGTTNVLGVVNSNWQQLEAIFNPTAGSVIAYKAVAQQATPARGDRITWGASAPLTVPAFLDVTYAASINVEFEAASLQRVALTGDLTLVFPTKFEGAKTALVLESDASARTITLPAGARHLGGSLTIPANKAAWVEVAATSTTDASLFFVITHEV